MAPPTREHSRVSVAGFHDLDERPPFKFGLQKTGDQWYLYVAHMWDSGWSVMDVTNPAEPELLNFIEGPPNTLTVNIQVADGLMITALERPIPFGRVDGPQRDPDGPYEEGAYIWDVETDPVDPVLLGQYRGGATGTHRNYYAGGDYAYMAVSKPEFEGRILEIVDLSDPANPGAISRWWWPGQHENDEASGRVSGGFPGFGPSYFHGPAYVVGDVAYLSYGRVGMVILDIQDKNEPRLMSHLEFGDLGSPIGVHSAIPVPETDLIVVNDEGTTSARPLDEEGNPLNYVFLVDGSDLSDVTWDTNIQRGPKVISSVPIPQPEPSEPFDTYYDKPGWFGPHNQHHYRGESTRYKPSDALVMTWFNAGLRIFDVSNPLAPVETGYYVPDDPEKRIGDLPTDGLATQFDEVVVDSRGYMYCSDKNHGLFILESELL